MSYFFLIPLGPQVGWWLWAMAFPQEVPFITLKEAKVVPGVQFHNHKDCGTLQNPQRSLERKEGGGLRGGRAVGGLQDQMAGAGEQGWRGSLPPPPYPGCTLACPEQDTRGSWLCVHSHIPLSKVLMSGPCGYPVDMFPCVQAGMCTS